MERGAMHGDISRTPKYGRKKERFEMIKNCMFSGLSDGGGEGAGGH